MNDKNDDKIQERLKRARFARKKALEQSFVNIQEIESKEESMIDDIESTNNDDTDSFMHDENSIDKDINKEVEPQKRVRKKIVIKIKLK